MAKAPFKFPLCSSMFGGTGHILDADGDVVLCAIVPKDGEPCADRLDARREYAIKALNAYAKHPKAKRRKPVKR